MENSIQQITFQQAGKAAQRKFLTQVYLWMMGALLISGAAAFTVASSPSLLRFVFGKPIVFYGLMFAELAIVFFLSLRIREMSVPAAFVSFILYSLINGATLSVIFFAYSGASIARVFIMAALMFGVMSVYGLTTKSDLRSIGSYLFMALIGILIALVINIFLRSSGLDWVISIITVFIFTGLTAYDTQKLLSISVYADDSAAYKKVAVIGALELYLDFINLFLALLRLFGRKND